MMTQFKCWIFLLTIGMQNSFPFTKGAELPETIYELCPFSDICNKTASRSLEVNGKFPCCSSCSCDEDCGLRMDCCFGHLDKYKFVEKGMVACIQPKLRGGKIVKAAKGYFMVQACDINNSDTLNSDIAITRCRLTDDKGNSLIAPVSSLETNLIYINLECAVCNKIDTNRIKQWNYLIESQSTPTESFVTEVQNNLWMYLKAKTYIPPTGEHWSHKQCYNIYREVTDCPINNEWQTLCRELRASFSFLKKIFKNVFCILCSGIPIQNIKIQCTPPSGRDVIPFSILLDYAVIEASKPFRRVIASTGLSKSKFVCPTGYVEDLKKLCLPMKCPEGMLRTQKGCTYFATEWYPRKLIMQIKLSQIKGTRLLAANLPLVWLTIPCRQVGLTKVKIYHSTSDDVKGQSFRNNTRKDYITSLVARISKNVLDKTKIDPSVVIPLFHRCVTEEWIAKLGNETHIFDAKFDKYIGYIQDGRQKLKKWPGEEKEKIARPALYTPPLRYVKLGTGQMMLKKPFFCNKVHVPIDDVDINFGEILIKSKNISLGTNEYLVNMHNVKGDVNVLSWNRTTFSVCIDDYDPSYTEASGSTKYISLPSETFFKIFLVSFVLL